jgi:hypothetical protein
LKAGATPKPVRPKNNDRKAKQDTKPETKPTPRPRPGDDSGLGSDLKNPFGNK